MTTRRAVTPAFAWLLVAALLAVQMLGLAHRVTHAGHVKAWPAERATTGSLDATPTSRVGAPVDVLQAPRAAGFFAALFGGHAGQRDCDAFDQLSHADIAFASSPTVAAEPPPSARFAFHASWHIAAQAHGFLARGPPVIA